MAKKKVPWLYRIFVAAVVVVLIVVFVAGAKPDYTNFAQCLSEKEVTMYGAYWCSHCENQKKGFGDAFVYVNYVECDPEGLNSQTQLCKDRGIQGYPTWEVNGNLLPGEVKLEVLSTATGCALP